jgi:hypothetical protein
MQTYKSLVLHQHNTTTLSARKRDFSSIRDVMEDSDEEGEEDDDSKDDDSKVAPNVDWEHYFDNNIAHASFMKHHTKDEGKKYLTALQLANGVDASTVTNLDADISMLTSSLLLRISQGERTILAQLMTKLVKKLHRDMTTSLSGVAKVPVPSSKNELRRFMDGKVAVLNNVPTPLVSETVNGCYVLPSDFLRLYFCFGVLAPHMIKCEDDIEYNGNEISTIWQTKKARESL